MTIPTVSAKIKNNRFYLHRKDIVQVSMKSDLDMHSASRKWAKDTHQSGYLEELRAWDAECIKFTRVGALPYLLA